MKSDHAFPAAFGRLIKRRRGELGLTQQQLAEKVWTVSANGESRKGDISKLEGGKSNPQADTIQRLADALDISPAELDALRLRAALPVSVCSTGFSSAAWVCVRTAFAVIHQTNPDEAGILGLRASGVLRKK